MKRFVFALTLLSACHHAAKAAQQTSAPTGQTQRVDIVSVDTHFQTRDHFMASFEMQLSGEPFAESMGRDLSGYSRDFVPPNMYFDPSAGGTNGTVDLPGFSTGVESYEYSKQPMNNVAFESGAGTALAFAPVLNASGLTGASGLANLRAWVQKVGPESNATSRFVFATVTASNPLGWPGFWPTLHPFTAFDPTIAPTNHVDLVCSISSDDDPGSSGSLLSNDYECDYSTLHLPSRDTQVTKTISPGASGWAAWKYALWTLNYLQTMHDSQETAVDTVDESDLGQVGASGNGITGDGGVTGTFLGSSDIEGFQAAMFITIMDNQAQSWLEQLSTTDGSTLGGFGSTTAALNYSSSSPLRWFPGELTVTETTDASGFPKPTFAVSSSVSHLLDLSGMLGSISSLYALTDHNNTGVGGSQAARAYFDGDPFPDDNQTPDGEATPHDRAIALMRVLLVNIDRMHFNGTLLVDDQGGTTLSTDVAAYAMLALRTARRSLDSQLALYSNTKPDTLNVPTPLDALPQVNGQTQGARIDAMIGALATHFYTNVSTSDGHSYGSWNVQTNAAGDDGNQLDAHTAAIRGLWTAYLATGDTKYRDRAVAVFQRLDGAFYDPAARVYHVAAGDGATQIEYTPRRFGLLQAAMRDTYELYAVTPGQSSMASLIEDRVARLNKLVLNGWDDRNQDQTVTADECMRVVNGLARGGLQMGERTLTGETGTQADNLTVPRVITTDRDGDCVPEISAAQLPSALADSVTLQLSPM